MPKQGSFNCRLCRGDFEEAVHMGFGLYLCGDCYTKANYSRKFVIDDYPRRAK